MQLSETSKLENAMLVSSGCCNKTWSIGWFNNRHLFLIVPEAGKSKIKLLDNLVPDEGPLPHRVCRWLPVCPVSSHWQRESSDVSPSFYKVSNPIIMPMKGSTFMASSKSNYLPKAPNSKYYHTVKLGLQNMYLEWGRGHNSIHSKC